MDIDAIRAALGKDLRARHETHLLVGSLVTARCTCEAHDALDAIEAFLRRLEDEPTLTDEGLRESLEQMRRGEIIDITPQPDPMRAS